MAKFYNLARMLTATTGTGTITLSTAKTGFLSFATAGVSDGEVIAYAIADGANSEVGWGVYTASGTTLTRNVRRSTNSNNTISLSGSAEVVITPAAEDLASIAQSQCRLTKSGSNLLLSRYNGSRIFINNGWFDIPSGGVTLSASGLSTNTLYYIYAYVNSGTLTLEASATAPAADSATGIQIKTGDATRSVVGMARTITGPAWQDTAAQRFVISYYNRLPIAAINVLSLNFTTTSTTDVDAMPSNRAEFLTWADQACECVVASYNYNSTAAYCITKASFDGGTSSYPTASYGTNGSPCTAVQVDLLSAGYHYATAMVKVGSGTGTWQGNASNAQTFVVAKTFG